MLKGWEEAKEVSEEPRRENQKTIKDSHALGQHLKIASPKSLSLWRVPAAGRAATERKYSPSTIPFRKPVDYTPN